MTQKCAGYVGVFNMRLKRVLLIEYRSDAALSVVGVGFRVTFFCYQRNSTEFGCAKRKAQPGYTRA